jgi:hypothetical protein
MQFFLQDSSLLWSYWNPPGFALYLFESGLLVQSHHLYVVLAYLQLLLAQNGQLVL